VTSEVSPASIEPVECLAVCICTAARPLELRRLLDALPAQEWVRDHPKGVWVVVIDNNPGGDARSVVDAWAGGDSLPFLYRHVAHRNISASRNAALEAASTVADLAALIDDDEMPEPGWLTALVASYERTGSPVTIGRVLALLPERAPTWLVDGNFHALDDDLDGASLRDGLTGNALLHLPSIARHGLSFDERFGASGGEDQLFFRQARAAGMTLVYARDAVLSEVVQDDRLSLRFLVKRSYRKGNTLGLLARHHRDLGERPLYRFAASVKWVGRGLEGVLDGVVRGVRVRLFRGIVDLSFAVGMWAGLAGARYDEYAQASLPHTTRVRSRAGHSPGSARSMGKAGPRSEERSADEMSARWS
jgi:succinoglycan biosynthesis protein ExoM